MAGGTASSSTGGAGAAGANTELSLQDLADLRHSFVMRQGQFLPVDFTCLLHEGDTLQNIYLQPDDFVYIPSASAQQVYVLGAVKFPRSVPYTDKMTLVSALASAASAATVDWFVPGNYGVTADAYLSHVAVVRGSLSSPQLSVVDYGAIIKGKAPDVLLELGDIVFIPNAPLQHIEAVPQHYPGHFYYDGGSQRRHCCRRRSPPRHFVLCRREVVPAKQPVW